MPLPIMLVAASAPSAASTAYTGVSWALTAAFCYGTYRQEQQQSSSFVDEAADISNEVREDFDELASRAAESLRKDDVQSKEEAKHMEECLARFDSGLTSMESNASSLDEVVDEVVASGTTQSEILQDVAKAQAEIKSGLDLQQPAMESIAESLKNLPELLQANREKQALRIENERLRLERDGYAVRVKKLLNVSKEVKSDNDSLKAEVKGLEAKVSGYSTRLRDVIALAKEKQAENEALRNQLNEENLCSSTQSATFSTHFFS